MNTFTVKAYPAIILSEGTEYQVNIGVVEKGVPFEAYFDSWIDPTIYYTVEDHELPELKAGYELDSGTTLVSIDLVDPAILEDAYDPTQYEGEDTF